MPKQTRHEPQSLTAVTARKLVRRLASVIGLKKHKGAAEIVSEELKQLLRPDQTYSHFSNKPLEAVHSVKQQWRYGQPCENEKPRGFWISVDGADDWNSWCESENYGIGSIRHRVVLASDANILYCRDALDLDCFTEIYGIEILRYSWRRIAIEWQRVADDYQGLVIAPYVWDRRLHDGYNWYYGWDCASGCIWDAAAIGHCTAA
jgi:hypothetical protein